MHGGYVVFHKNASGQLYEILIMDTDNIETAQNVWRWNQNGWGHSKSGYNGPYTMAATIDDGIVADFITAGTMLAYWIKGGTLTLGGPGNGNGLCEVYDILGNLIGSISNNGILLKKGKMDIRSDNADENYIDLHWQYAYPSGTQYYRTMVRPSGTRVLIQDSKGTKRYAALHTSGYLLRVLPEVLIIQLVLHRIHICRLVGYLMGHHIVG